MFADSTGLQPLRRDTGLASLRTLTSIHTGLDFFVIVRLPLQPKEDAGGRREGGRVSQTEEDAEEIRGSASSRLR